MSAILLTALAIIVVVFVITAALQPGEVRVSRSISMAAPPAVPFSHVNDLRKWLEVSPYTHLDPMASYAFDGPSAGVGATMSWIGNSKIGEGRMTITAVQPDKAIEMRLEFVKPFASTCVAEFLFVPEHGQTMVTWRTAGPKNFICKAMGLLVNMDRMIGRQFEEGLDNLKRRSETADSFSAPTA